MGWERRRLHHDDADDDDDDDDESNWGEQAPSISHSCASHLYSFPSKFTGLTVGGHEPKQ